MLGHMRQRISPDAPPTDLAQKHSESSAGCPVTQLFLSNLEESQELTRKAFSSFLMGGVGEGVQMI